MNILFLTIGEMKSIDAHGIYTDLIRGLRDEGHSVYTVYPSERRNQENTEYYSASGVGMLRVKTGNITKCNLIEKGISTVLIGSVIKSAIKKYLSNVKFDLVLYSTPPITFCSVIEYIKKRDGAKSYLMLKDIFPQNSVDLGMLTRGGLKGFIYKYFRGKEKKLYALSDKIGCMSPANCEFVKANNPWVDESKLEICPNCEEIVDKRVDCDEKLAMRERFGLPTDKKIFVYGGNLGRPQDVPFIVECLKACADIEGAHFVVAGSGTDRHFLEEYAAQNPSHLTLFGYIPKNEYDNMIACCDIGLIFLDHRFTIPNFPSRLLSYMQAGLPVLACTDVNTDIGKIVVEGGFGRWCESNSAEGFAREIREALGDDLQAQAEKEFAYLVEHYSIQRGIDAVLGR